MSIISTRIARRLVAEKLTKQWLMGIRKAWLQFMKPPISDFGDVMKAHDQLDLFVERLREQIKHIRRGGAKRLLDDKYEAKLETAFDKVIKTIEESRSKAGHWKSYIDGTATSLRWGEDRTDDALHMLDLYKRDFAEASGTAIETRGRKWKTVNLTDLLDVVLKLLRSDAAAIKKHDEANPDAPFKELPEILKEFHIGDMKFVLVLGPDDHISAATRYVGLLKKAHALVQSKKLKHLWYGVCFLSPSCEKLDERAIENYEKAGYDRKYIECRAGWYRYRDDTMAFTSYPTGGFIYGMIHELGHRQWFKFMSSTQRVRFADLINSKGVDAVSDYGKSNPEEAFAEAFARYIMGKDMTRNQMESFREVSFGRRSAMTERVADRFASRIAKINSPLPEWGDVVADMRAFNHFYDAAKKLLRDNPTREDREKLGEYEAVNTWPHTAEALSTWMMGNFTDATVMKHTSLGFKLGRLAYPIIRHYETDPKEIKDFLVKLDQYADMVNALISQVYPARFTYQGFKIKNSKRMAEPLVRGCLDGIDFAVALFKKRGLSKGLAEAVKSIELVWEPRVSWAGLYHGNTSIITINATSVGSSFTRLWTNWVQEIFVHEFGHHVEKSLPPEAWQIWESAWGEADAAKEKLGEKTSVTGAERLKFFNMLESLQWNLAAAAKKYKGLDKLKLGAWLRSPWTGAPLITPKRFRLTQRGQYMFTFLANPEETYRDELSYPPKGENPELDESLETMLQNRLGHYHKSLGVDKGSLGLKTPIPADIAEEMRKEDKTVAEALDKLELPSDYARINPAEDFAESFLAFMVNPGALSKQAMFRMKQVLSLAGLYGGSVMRLAQRVTQRYIESGYLNVGDVILYGKFKNAKGKIVSFGKNEKGDPTMEVQPIDKDGKSKGGKTKSITMLKVRKVPKKTAGGIDVSEDVTPLLSAIGASLGSVKSKDIAYAAYAFDYISGTNKQPKIITFAADLATEYARRFAEWLGFVFLNRANMTQKSKPMKALQEAMADWVEGVPDMIRGSNKTRMSDFMPEEAMRFLNTRRIDAIGDKILRVIYQDWMSQGKTARGMNELPVTFNRKFRHYEIPKSNMTYKHRSQLRDLGFEFNGQVWYTEDLDSSVLRALPQAANLSRGGGPPSKPLKDPREWFFSEWLPKNVDRFSKVFTDYGRAEGVPYEFKFNLSGEEITVQFQRNIETIDQAIAEIESRYGTSSDRDGWLQAVKSYRQLMKVSGRAAIHAVDIANNLEHTHGAMMEHFPPGVRSWYPRFLDFKYTAHVWQLIRAINDEDIRVVATELMPIQDRMDRLVTPQVDHRTPKGLALEISSQPGKSKKRKMLQEVKEDHPDLYDAVVQNLEEKGLHLTAARKTP